MGKSAFSTRLVGTVPEPALANLEDSTSELNEAFIGAQLKFTDLAGCSEWMKLAELALVVVPDSVGDERMFSALKYLKSP
eukprot:1147883-Pelagomonas_calceolata.AAC.1